MNYFISDLHFFCKSQTGEGSVNYDNRPFATMDEMHTTMLQSWNEKVTNGDTVYILGDVALRGRNEGLIALVAQLRGKKVLVKGNHDDLSDYRYKQLFHEITDYKELTETIAGQAHKLVLSHYPILMWKDQHKGAILLYGHTHTSVEDKFFQDCIARMNESEELSLRRHGCSKIRAINVGCMQPWMAYAPQTLDEIIRGWELCQDKEPLSWEMDKEGLVCRCPRCGYYAKEDEYTGKRILTKYCPECGQRLATPQAEGKSNHGLCENDHPGA